MPRPRTILETNLPTQWLNELKQADLPDPLHRTATYWKSHLPHALVRAILIAAITPITHDPQRALDIYRELIQHPHDPQDTPLYPPTAIHHSTQHHDLPPTLDLPHHARALHDRLYGPNHVIHDPLAGIHTYPITAAILGIDAHGTELNPTPHTIAKTLTNVITNTPRRYMQHQRALERALDDIREALDYHAPDHPHPNGWEPIHYIYTQLTHSPHTNTLVPTYTNPTLANGTHLITTHDPHTNTHHTHVIHQPHQTQPTLHKNQLTYQCNHQLITEPHKPTTPTRDTLIAIQWRTPNGKLITEPTPQAKTAEARIQHTTPTHPTTAFGSNPVVERVRKEFGWVHWGDFFNARQRLVNGLIWELLPEEAYPLAWRVLQANNRLSYWTSDGGGYVQGLFAFGGFNLIHTYAAMSTNEALRHIRYTPNYPKTAKHTLTQGDARRTPAPPKTSIIITEIPTDTSVPIAAYDFFNAWGATLNPTNSTTIWDARTPYDIQPGDTQALIDTINNAKITLHPEGLLILTARSEPPNFWTDILHILTRTNLELQSIWRTTIKEQKSIRGYGVKELTIITATPQTNPQHTYTDELHQQIHDSTQQTTQRLLQPHNHPTPPHDDRDITTAIYATAIQTITQHTTIDQQPINTLTPQQLQQWHHTAQQHATQWLKPHNLPTKTWNAITPTERHYLQLLTQTSGTRTFAKAAITLARTHEIDKSTTVKAAGGKQELIPIMALRNKKLAGTCLGQIHVALQHLKAGDRQKAAACITDPHAVVVLEWMTPLCDADVQAALKTLRLVLNR